MSTEFEEKRLQIIFDGELNEVDAQTFIGSLENITTIIYELNREVNKEFSTNFQVKVKIKAFSPGSFVLHLGILSQISEIAQELFTAGHIQSAAHIVAILTGILGLKKILKGKKPQKVTKAPENKVIVEGDDNKHITIDNRVFNIYMNNGSINEALDKNFSILDSDKQIKGFKIAEEESPVFVADKEDFKGLSHQNELLESDKRTIIDEAANLNVFKLVFDPKYKWQFYYEGNKISAHINDRNFFQSINEGERFSKGDTLICELEIIKEFNMTVNTFVNKDYVVKRVLRHEPRNPQTDFDFEK